MLPHAGSLAKMSVMVLTPWVEGRLEFHFVLLTTIPPKPILNLKGRHYTAIKQHLIKILA